MPTRGGKNVRRNMRRLVREIRGPITNRAMTEILIAGEAYAAALTPIDTSNLINSRYRQVTNTQSGTRGIVGYTADYALYVHEAPGTLKGQPRDSVSSFSASGGRTGFASNSGRFWEPNGEPQFLMKGFQQAKPEIREILRRNYRR